MKIRVFIGAMVLPFLALMMILAGCGGDSGSTGGSSKVTITFWSRDSDAALVQPLMAAYNASHQNQVKLTLIPANSFVTKFGSAVASGDVPDLVATDLVYTPSFASKLNSATLRTRTSTLIAMHPMARMSDK